MDIQVNPKSVQSIENSAVLQQTSFWASVKRYLGCTTLAFDISVGRNALPVKRDTDKQPTDATDDILVVIQSIGHRRYIAHVPYGPVIEPEEEWQGAFLEELSESLRPLLPEGCLLIRYDLRWESPWAHDEDRFNSENFWQGPPPPEVQEMRMNFNTQEGNLRKTQSDILPSSTIFIRLQREEENLLKRMKPKTRYNIQLAKRRGVEVAAGNARHLAEWYELYRQTAERNHIFLQDISYFEALLKTNKNHDEARVELLLAEADGEAQAGMFLVMAGGRATYLYGASGTRNRNLMGTYALQWEAIRRAKKAGCTEYDMFGISQPARPSHPLYGLYRFKQGFGGYIYRRMGCWDYPLLTEEYDLFRSMEMNSTGYHLKT